MGRTFNPLFEALALYVICAAFTLGFLWLAGFHFDGSGTSWLMAGAIIAAAPACFVAATRGTWVREGMIDREAPVRPLAMLAPTATTFLASSELPVVGGRQSFQLCYASHEGLDSLDVMDRLAKHIADIGIECSNLGALHARDHGVEWRLAPVLGDTRVEGWVEAADPRDRASVIAAITEFLEQGLGLNVEVTR